MMELAAGGTTPRGGRKETHAMIDARTTSRDRRNCVVFGALTIALALAAGAFGEGGNIPATALEIDAVPFADSGNTADNGDNVDPSCAEDGSPDVWYSFTPEEDMEITLSLCGSSYDTVLYILDQFLVEIACNDDSDACGEQSELLCLPMEAGETYYIGVDGDDGAAGPYQFAMTICLPPLPCGECAPWAFLEGEPTCHDDYDDQYNGGCNSSPHVFQEILAGDTVCGESGTYELTRELWSDTDWYELQITEMSDITWEGVAEFPLYLIIWDGNQGCDGMYSLGWRATNEVCEPLTVTAHDVPPGTYWLWVGLWTLSQDYPCGVQYNARVIVAPSTPCEVECAPNAIDEGEEDCHDGYIDQYNGGCNSDPYAFQPIADGDIICGTSGTYLVGADSYRDTDWYEFSTTQICDLTWDVLAEFDMVLFLIEADPEACPDPPILASNAGGACQITTLSYPDLAPGTYWLFIAPAVWNGVPCGAVYEASFALHDCEDPPDCPEDLDGDLDVDTGDLLALLGDWGCEGEDCLGDIDGDGDTDTADLLALLAAWGDCP
jgi:hypothetical protein